LGDKLFPTQILQDKMHHEAITTIMCCNLSMLPKETYGITYFSIIPDCGAQLKKSNDIPHGNSEKEPEQGFGA